MNRLQSISRGSRFALIALVISQGLVLARSILIARALGPEQYGIAATFILLQQFLDSTSDTGLNKFVLSHARGHARTTIATVHAISVARAILVALLLALAWPVLHWQGIASSPLPVIVLAAASLAVGITHFDNVRRQRSSDFAGMSLTNLAAELLATLAALVLVTFDQSYMVALYVILAKSAATALMSFLLARRPYRLAFSQANARMIWTFSLPLMINGPLLFLTGQADRAVAALTLPPAQLGIYTSALLLIYTPSQLFVRYLGSIFLPQLSREVREEGQHRPRFGRIVAATSVAIAIGFALFGYPLIPLLFGEAFRLDWQIVALIGLAQGARFARVSSSSIALAYGATGSILAANIVRMAVLPLCFLGVWTIGGMLGLAIGALAGEAPALAYANWAVQRAIVRYKASTRREGALAGGSRHDDGMV